MIPFDAILKPTLLLDEDAARANIHRMAEKARAANVAFRPHFKTHQSAEIGEWFHAEGVRAITTSSLDMAEYFAAHGWTDITLAFSANLRQAAGMDRLAQSIRLGLLVESIETADYLGRALTAPVNLWIKIDAGAGRTGISWQDPAAVINLAKKILTFPQFHLSGLLTHAGHTYAATTPQGAAQTYAASVERIASLRGAFLEADLPSPLISTGDTPGCSAAQNFGPVDEIRPGNFVFYDAKQLQAGACSVGDVAVALACPVVALHPERDEAVVYGGSIHLSSDFFEVDGHKAYGMVALPTGPTWGQPLSGGYVARLSQEHGILHLRPDDLARLHIGDLVCVLPAHSCLTAQCMGHYYSLAGRTISMMH